MTTELEFIASEQAKCDKRLMRLLKKVDKTGECGREASERLATLRLIETSPPRPEIGNLYTCYRLTREGKDELDRLRWRILRTRR